MSTAKAKQAATVTTLKATKQIRQAETSSKDAIESMVKTSQDVAAQGYEKAVHLTKGHVEAAVKANTQAFKAYEDAVQSTKENMDAVVKAGTILTKGMQDLSKAVLGLTQETIEDGVVASKQIMAAKTLRELIDLQSSASKASLDKLLSEGTRLSDLSIKLFEEAFAPITHRVNATVDQLVKNAA